MRVGKGTGMVSLRNYFSICAMMAVLFCMFQFFLLFKESGNEYDTNEYVEDTALSGADQWGSGRQENAPEIFFLGRDQSGLFDVVSQWCLYTKHRLISADSIEDMQQYPKVKEVEMLLIDGSILKLPEQEKTLLELVDLGITIVFIRLPEVESLKACEGLQKMLGIVDVPSVSVEMEGIQIFSGFFLGGEAVYKTTEDMSEEQRKLQDMELTMPWYRLGVGTKVYMTGLLDEDEVERTHFPPLIWRSSCQGTLVFAVNGDYMDSLAGLGILDAFCYEKQDYYLYPVINARNTTVAGFPNFADENAEKIMQLYSRKPGAVQEDVMWPGLYALAEKNRQKFTFCFMTQYDYGDDVEAFGDRVVFFLQQIKEIGGEAGHALEYKGNITLSDKLAEDKAFWERNGSKYRFSAYYAGKNLDEEERETIEQGKLEDIRTVAVDYHQGDRLVSYWSDEVTVQSVTGYADQYSYTTDLQRRSLETALGYNNLLLDLKPVFWPESEDEQWENYFDEVSSNISTYWYATKSFESTTLTKSDSRVRNFLNLGYLQSRQADIITLEVEGSLDAWFILRTHREAIKEIKGGEYRALEKDVYLIHVMDSTVEIQLEKDAGQTRFYFS